MSADRQSIDEEVRQLIEDSHDEAYEVLVTNRDILDKLAAELLEHETLDQTALAAIFANVVKLPPRPQWLSSDKRPVSDRPPIAMPAPKVALEGAAASTDAGEGSGKTRREPTRAPRPATA